MALFYIVKLDTSEKKMKACKQTLEQIAVLGSNAAHSEAAHLAQCATCTAALKEAIAIEQLLLAPAELEPPVHLKYSILHAAREKKSTAFFPTFGFALKTLVVLLVLVSGFWLGLQMANGDYESKAGDFDVASAEAYQMNTAPAEPTNLGHVYLTVLQEAENAQ